MPDALIVGHHADEHSDHLEVVLSGRPDWRVWRVSIADVSTSFRWTPDGTLAMGNVELPRRVISGIWRRPGTETANQYAPEFRDFIARETHASFEGSLEGHEIRWLTQPQILRRAELKLLQLKAAAHVGARIPQTIVTNDPEQACAFADRVGAVVAKPVRYGLVRAVPEPHVAWTTSVSKSELAELQGPPIILQERLRANLHYRVTTVRDRAFVARLETSALDWRTDLQHHGQFERVPIGKVRQLVDEAVAIATALGIGFSTQDWIQDSDGDLFFLEANPNGQWLFVDTALGGEITEALIAALEALGG